MLIHGRKQQNSVKQLSFNLKRNKQNQIQNQTLVSAKVSFLLVCVLFYSPKPLRWPRFSGSTPSPASETCGQDPALLPVKRAHPPSFSPSFPLSPTPHFIQSLSYPPPPSFLPSHSHPHPTSSIHSFILSFTHNVLPPFFPTFLPSLLPSLPPLLTPLANVLHS